MSYVFDYVDLFAGPGGWDCAARELGLRGAGVEIDPAAVETRRAAGHPTVARSVAELGPADFLARVLIASPPCQTFSMAGKGAGRQALDQVLGLAERVAAGEPIASLGGGRATPGPC